MIVVIKWSEKAFGSILWFDQQIFSHFSWKNYFNLFLTTLHGSKKLIFVGNLLYENDVLAKIVWVLSDNENDKKNKYHDNQASWNL